MERSKAAAVSQSFMDRLSEHEVTLGRKLCEFLDSRIMYSFRRLPASELERIYVGPTDEGLTIVTVHSVLAFLSSQLPSST